eukprot:2478601-Prymnesium_polylepis.1
MDRHNTKGADGSPCRSRPRHGQAPPDDSGQREQIIEQIPRIESGRPIQLRHNPASEKRRPPNPGDTPPDERVFQHAGGVSRPRPP